MNGYPVIVPCSKYTVFLVKFDKPIPGTNGIISVLTCVGIFNDYLCTQGIYLADRPGERAAHDGKVYPEHKRNDGNIPHEIPPWIRCGCDALIS
jgi:hypothetical protein